MDKHLFRYHGIKPVMAVITILVLIQAIAILVQSVYLAKAIVGMYEGKGWMSVIFDFCIFFLALGIRQAAQWLKTNISYRFADKTARYYQNLLIENDALLLLNLSKIFRCYNKIQHLHVSSCQP